jgi:glycosyltransferase involved in cell wall biosynthesis
VRLGIVISHPIQYYAPWFRFLAKSEKLDLKVFYLWDFGVRETRDRAFKASFAWDIPLLDGYAHEFVPNTSRDPGTHHFGGLDNPTLVARLAVWQPEALLLLGYAYRSQLRVIFSRRLRRAPLLFRGDSHELAPSRGWKDRFKRAIRRRLFRRFRAVLAVGRANADYFRSSGVPEARIHFVPHCVDNERFRAAQPAAEAEAAVWKLELGIPRDTTVILFAGKFETKKQPLELLQAFQGLRDTVNVPAALLLVGSGALESELRRRAVAEIGRTVFIAPFQNQHAMPRVYAAGDLLVLPSRGRGETWGLVVNEAMNLGKPAIVSSHVGCGPDLVTPGETGWVFPAGDIGALTECLHTAAQNPERLRTMGAAARRRVEAYSYETATAALLDTLRTLQDGSARMA